MVLTRSSTTTEISSPLKVVYVTYHDTIEGHELMGRVVGTSCQLQIQRAVAADPEIKLALKIIQTERGKLFYSKLLSKIQAKYPKYLAELRGIRAVTGVPLKSLLVSCLRQEIGHAKLPKPHKGGDNVSASSSSSSSTSSSSSSSSSEEETNSDSDVDKESLKDELERLQQARKRRAEATNESSRRACSDFAVCFSKPFGQNCDQADQLSSSSSSSSSSSFKERMEVAAWGHNEDYSKIFAENNYVIVGKEISIINGEEHTLGYIAYTYAGCLPGWGPAYNSHGLAFSLNFLASKTPKVYIEGIPVAFASRDMLKARSLEEACRIVSLNAKPTAIPQNMKNGDVIGVNDTNVSTGGGGCGGGSGGDLDNHADAEYLAYGQSINMVDVRSGEAWNVEAGPGGVVDVLVIAQGIFQNEATETEKNDGNRNGGIVLVDIKQTTTQMDRSSSSNPFSGLYFHGNEYERIDCVVGAKDRSTRHRMDKFIEYCSKVPQSININNSNKNRALKRNDDDHEKNATILQEDGQTAVNSTSTKHCLLMQVGDILEIGGGDEVIDAAKFVESFLGDMTNKRWPVFRNAKSPDSCVTVMSWVIDRERNTLKIWGGDSPCPSLNLQPLFTFDLLNYSFSET